jgi:hypothetical protein
VAALRSFHTLPLRRLLLLLSRLLGSHLLAFPPPLSGAIRSLHTLLRPGRALCIHLLCLAHSPPTLHCDRCVDRDSVLLLLFLLLLLLRLLLLPLTLLLLMLMLLVLLLLLLLLAVIL